LLAVPIPTSTRNGQLHTTTTASCWLKEIARNIWLTEIASKRNPHTYTLIFIPSLIGELLLKKRRNSVSDTSKKRGFDFHMFTWDASFLPGNAQLKMSSLSNDLVNSSTPFSKNLSMRCL